MRSMLLGVLMLGVLLLCPAVFAGDDWGALQYLVGTWTGEGGGTPGQSAGSFSFTPDLQGKILVRKSRAEYAATKDKPAFAHDDLMIVFRESDETAEGALRAIYYDSEGHVIHYSVIMFGDRIVFTSEPSRRAPQYRFTYARQSTEELRMKFEIAPPGKGFVTYIEGAARRK
jgi:hypothetical protein